MKKETQKETQDISFMGMALDLARLAFGKTSPNPMVGAVIVKNGKVLGKGFHQKAGCAHAEIEALKECEGNVLENATLYVTLEPCCHQGRTPPCVDAILKSGIKNVVIGMKDPDPKVSGQGMRLLKKKGLLVKTGILEKECRELNAAYIKHRTTGLPYVTLKIASTLDGKIALAGGESQWITSEESRQMGHVLRDQHDAILVGINTIQNDDPQLTTRLLKGEDGRDPIRLILDSRLQISAKARVLRQMSTSPTWIATTLSEKDKKVKNFEKKFSRVSFEILSSQKDREGRVDLKAFLKTIAARGVVSVLVEGGPTVVTAFLQQKLADRLIHFIAPSYLGDGNQPALKDLAIQKMSQKIQLKQVQWRQVGPDMLCEGLLDL